ncbi:HD domain-containing protein [Lysinibacillus yapensis]|uniref:HD domain-containing protein n=1 Tax=Ureibacillus yapensis TaxID=2304605 RepID=A0A396SP60_9BACL|nr:HD domain-containing protein [Lysinibacillus yapensis]RHW37640.1 HD domain-containing protein [Lysinibacillus yapensis]
MEKLLKDVKRIYEQFDASHDFQHIERVLQNAESILATEPDANKEIVRIAVLLHDVSDKKYSEDKEAENNLLHSLNLSADQKQHIKEIIESVSFNGGNEIPAKTIEAKIVRDADRLDAIGAVGIARTFAYGGAKGRKLYDDAEEVRLEMSEEEYRSKNTASVTHFYEKLLLLKDLMTTVKGKQMAEERHAFMETFLHQLKNEREGKA